MLKMALLDCSIIEIVAVLMEDGAFELIFLPHLLSTIDLNLI